jgi:Fuc2NAc and GlcNAc transferase
MNIIAVLLGTFAFSVILVAFVRRYALNRNIVDLPNMRSSHSVPTPRAGGIGIVVAFNAAILILARFGLIDLRSGLTLVVSGGVIACIGYVDDRWHLTAKSRLSVHVAVAVAVVALVGGFPEPELSRWGMSAYWVGLAFTVIVLTWSTNLFNFMDGIDGIAGSESIFVSSAAAWLNWLGGGDSGMTAAMLSLSAASLGYLVWNWPPARIFMGDVGSGFLGFMLTALFMMTTQRSRMPIEVLPILGGVFLVDATTTLLTRLLRGDRWLEPHRMHAYQHLARKLGSHERVTLTVIAVNLGWLLPWAYVVDYFPDNARICFLVALWPLVAIALFAGAGRPTP